ncbi:MAG: hypothetical protein MUC35_03420 [Candidatus Margulisbacteria bacterium]|jgi:hypothetical protein|nr:hypothetical protein [Candidatus Margulisiibacteriota bacterium]
MGRQIAIILILLATLAYATVTYWPLLQPYLPKSQPARPAVTTPAPGPVAAASREAAAKKKEEVDDLVMPTAEVRLIDPFALRIEVKTRAESPLPLLPTSPADPSKPVVKPVEPHLEGVWIDAERKIAFISGQSYSVGGVVLGWKVTAIGKDRVTLQKGSAIKTLKVEGK